MMIQQIRKRRRLILRIGVVVIILGSIGSFIVLFPRKKITIPQCQQCNIIFVSFDTLRARNVHFMGYERTTSQTLDRLAQKGFVFTNAITVAPWTLPSTMSWFTGVYPSTHQVLNKYRVVGQNREVITNLSDVSPQLTTLAEVLHSHGYRTAAFTGGAGVDSQFGFDKGFEQYFDDINFGGFADSAPRALDWVAQHKDEHVFMFLHGYDVHGQYVPEGGYDHRFVDFEYKGKLTGSKKEQEGLREEGVMQGGVALTPEDVRFLKDLYDEKVQRADEQLAQFLEEYQNLGLMGKTILIITSDHGDEFYEHGRIDHGHSLYDELLQVPLLIIVPGLSQKIEIHDQVRSIDLFPTILSLAQIGVGASISAQLEGTSVVPLMQGNHENRDVFSETDYLYGVQLRSVRTNDSWKVIANIGNGITEAYNLLSDKLEKNPLQNSDVSRLKNLRERLHFYYSF
jgi:arylsulfatase A-like enzyme